LLESKESGGFEISFRKDLEKLLTPSEKKSVDAWFAVQEAYGYGKGGKVPMLETLSGFSREMVRVHMKRYRDLLYFHMAKDRKLVGVKKSGNYYRLFGVRK